MALRRRGDAARRGAAVPGHDDAPHGGGGIATVTRARIGFWTVLGFGLALRVALFPGTQVSDDLAYNKIADDIRQGRYRLLSADDPKPLRFGLLLPLAAVQAVFGAGEFTGILPSLLAWPVLVGLLWTLARRLFDERAALVACALSALCPLDVLMSGMMFPEVPATAVALAALLLLERGRAGLAGVLIGVAYLMKENAVYWIPAMLLWILWRRHGWRPAALLCGGAVLVFLGECIFYFAATGDALFRVHVNQGGYLRELDTIYYPTSAAVVKRILIDLPNQLLNPAREASTVYGGLFLVGLGAGIYGWIVDRRRFAGPILLFVGLFLAFDLFPARLYPFMPNTILYRYLFPMLIPVYLIVGAALTRRKRRWILPVAAAFSLYLAWMTHVVHVDAANRAGCARRAVRTALERGAARIHTDAGTAQVAELLSGFRSAPEIRVLAPDRSGLGSGDWVILNSQMLDLRKSMYAEEPGPQYDDPPGDWIPVSEVRPLQRLSLRAILTRSAQPVQTTRGARIYRIP